MILLVPATWVTAQAIKPRVTVESGKQAVKEFFELEKGLVSKEREAVQQIAEQSKVEHEKIRDEMVAKLKGFLEAETKAGNLDEALELRNAIEFYERYRRKPVKAQSAAMKREIKELKTKLAKIETKPTLNIPKEAVKWNGHSYMRVDTWHCRNVALAMAEASGGHLVRIQDKEEHDFVHNLVKSAGAEWYILDGNDEHTEGRWVWSNNEPAAYLDWDAKEPTGANTRSKVSFSHVLFMNTRTGKMHDGSGGQRAGFVIEWDQ